jgi:hypothetical protein
VLSARRVGLAVTGVVLVASGAYVLVYLYRWEWNRALIAGVFFVAAELALTLQLVLGRISGLEARLDAHLAATPDPLDRIRETAPEPHRPFAWLDPGDPRGAGMGVFIPVLLGAGVVLSVVASLIEKVSGATARPVLERRLADRLAPLTLPAGGFLDPAPPPPPAMAPGRARLRRSAVTAAATVATALVVGGAVVAMASNTKDGHDVVQLGTASEVIVDIEHRFSEGRAAATAEALWVSCRGTIGRPAHMGGIADAGGGRLSFVVEPGLGEHATKRFRGCMEDALFDRVSAAVTVTSGAPRPVRTTR